MDAKEGSDPSNLNISSAPLLPPKECGRQIVQEGPYSTVLGCQGGGKDQTQSNEPTSNAPVCMTEAGDLQKSTILSNAQMQLCPEMGILQETPHNSYDTLENQTAVCTIDKQNIPSEIITETDRLNYINVCNVIYEEISAPEIRDSVPKEAMQISSGIEEEIIEQVPTAPKSSCKTSGIADTNDNLSDCMPVILSVRGNAVDLDITDEVDQTNDAEDIESSQISTSVMSSPPQVNTDATNLSQKDDITTTASDIPDNASCAPSSKGFYASSVSLNTVSEMPSNNSATQNTKSSVSSSSRKKHSLPPSIYMNSVSGNEGSVSYMGILSNISDSLSTSVKDAKCNESIKVIQPNMTFSILKPIKPPPPYGACHTTSITTLLSSYGITSSSNLTSGVSNSGFVVSSGSLNSGCLNSVGLNSDNPKSGSLVSESPRTDLNVLSESTNLTSLISDSSLRTSVTDKNATQSKQPPCVTVSGDVENGQSSSTDQLESERTLNTFDLLPEYRGMNRQEILASGLLRVTKKPRIDLSKQHVCFVCGHEFHTEEFLQFHFKRNVFVLTYDCRICHKLLTFHNKCTFVQHFLEEASRRENLPLRVETSFMKLEPYLPSDAKNKSLDCESQSSQSSAGTIGDNEVTTVVTSDQSISTTAVPGDQNVSTTAVPGDQNVSTTAVLGDQNVSTAAVPGDQNVSATAVHSDLSISTTVVHSNQNASIAVVSGETSVSTMALTCDQAMSTDIVPNKQKISTSAISMNRKTSTSVVTCNHQQSTSDVSSDVYRTITVVLSDHRLSTVVLKDHRPSKSVVSNTQRLSTTVVPSDHCLSTTVVPGNQIIPKTIVSSDQSLSVRIIPKDARLSTTVLPVDQRPSITVVSKGQMPSPRVIPSDQGLSTSVVTSDQGPSTLLYSNDQGPSSALNSNDQGPSTTLNSNDQGPSTTLNSSDQGPPTTLNSSDQGPSTTLSSSDQRPSTTLNSNDQGPSTTLNSNDQGPSTTLNSNDQGPSTTLNSSDQCPSTTLNSNDQCPSTTVVPSDRTPLTTEVISPIGPWTTYRCQFCISTFPTMSCLFSHFQRVEDDQTYSCHICNMELFNPCSLSAHLSIHKAEEKKDCVTCPECGESLLKYCKDFRLLFEHLDSCGHFSVWYTSICLCGKAFKSYASLAEHFLDEHLLVRFQCRECCLVRPTMYLIYLHYKNKHPLSMCTASVTVLCPWCEQYFSNPTALKSHVAKELATRNLAKRKVYQCIICSGSFPSASLLNTHQAHFHIYKPKRCTLCYGLFMGRQNLVNHLVSKSCSKKFPKMLHLCLDSTSENERHFDNKRFAKLFEVKGLNIGHVKMVSSAQQQVATALSDKDSQSEATVPILICPPTKAKKQKNMENRQSRTSHVPSDLRLTSKQITAWDGSKHQCHLCKICLVGSINFKKHMSHHRSVDSQTCLSHCIVCKKMVTETSISSHMEEHQNHGVIVCSLCHRRDFPNLSLARDHSKNMCYYKEVTGWGEDFLKEKSNPPSHGNTDGTEHGPSHENSVGENRDLIDSSSSQDKSLVFPCLMCGLAFSSKAAKDDHVSRVHDGTKTFFLCLVCKRRGTRRAFNKKQKASVHIARKHRIVNAIEISKLILQEEQNISSGQVILSDVSSQESVDEPPPKRLRQEAEDAFLCGKCGFSNGQRDIFEQHVKTHNPKGEPQCPECGLCFTVNTALKKHLFAVHRIKDVEEYMKSRGIEEVIDDVSSDDEDMQVDVISSVSVEECEENPLKSNKSSKKKSVTDNPWECNVCYKSFTSELVLKSHMRNHGMAFIRSRRDRNKDVNSISQLGST